MDIGLLIGAFGAFLILIAFVMGQLHRWNDTYFVYDFLNGFGSALLVYYAVLGNSWPFIILNTVWGIVSFRGCYIDLKRNAKKKSGTFWKKWME